ncbi:MAG: hypothetical protein Q8R53_01415 [Nanoarchaeota archaeon]|nr:hypothetical protein [Nanoarchaeota archaeon]
MEINPEGLKQYLESIYSGNITDVRIQKLGEGCVGTGFSLDFKVNGKTQRKILKTLFTENLGMDHFSDRAGSLLLAHSHYAKIPNHIASSDVCGITKEGEIISLGNAHEFFILMEEAQGKDMFNDFQRIAKTNLLTDADRKRILQLSDFLVTLHQEKPSQNKASLYKRCLRNIIGGNTSIMSIIDMYPKDVKWVSKEEINQLLQASIHFWITHRFNEKRLCHTHGDFHPGNIWFKDAENFTLLDRSGQTYGEAADDLTAFSVNFIFYSLKERGEFSGAAKEGFDLFWKNYISKTNDTEIVNLAPPFFALRAMVVANPMFYGDDFFGSPENAHKIRSSLFHFALQMVQDGKCDLDNIETYF